MTAFDGWVAPDRLLPERLDPVVEHGVRYPLLDAEASRRLVDGLRAARTDALLGLRAGERARILGRVGRRFLDPADPLRRAAEASLPGTADLSPEMARAVLDGMARDWTGDRLARLLAAEMADPEALDRFVPSRGGGRIRAISPELAFHVGAGTVPGVSATSLVRSLLVGSATLLKPGLGDVVLPVLFARGLREEAPRMADAVAVMYWAGGSDSALERVAIERADLVVAYGSDASILGLSRRLPATTPLVAYHHRVGVAVIGRDALTREALPHLADALARATATFDQRGCVSCQAAFVERGGEVDPSALAAETARALARLHTVLPPTPPAPALASAVHQLRRTAELRRASGEPVEVHAEPTEGWTVLLEPPETPEPSLGRTLRVHAVDDAAQVGAHLAPIGRHLQTVGVAGLGPRLDELAVALGALGASRVCPLTDVAFPPPWWHHDGRGPLEALLRWVDLEGE